MLFDDTLDKLIKAGQDLANFVLMSPISVNDNYPNYKIKNKKILTN